MTVRPLRFAAQPSGRVLFTNDAGRYFLADDEFLGRYAEDRLTADDHAFLREEGHIVGSATDLHSMAHLAHWVQRLNLEPTLSYVILVPTLRCNLACDYCQVSRAAEAATGFDWSEQTLRDVLTFLDDLKTEHVKIEFQGGEPLLRLDLLEQVRAFCRRRFKSTEFVVCTNLQAVSEEAWAFLGASDTWISTSFDGTSVEHQRMRTKSGATQDQFEANLRRALQEYGAEKVSALPTIDPVTAPEPRAVIEAYARLGLRSIYLRRINYQGFARKRFSHAAADAAWFDYHRRFIEAIMEYNVSAEEPLEEYYTAHLIRRIVRGGHNHHVDLRNPNWIGADYIVVDHDGRLYPTDEARMVSRAGQVDLSIGAAATGPNRTALNHLNAHVSTFDDPDCMHCAFQPYCGLDPVDDISRYGRVDLPRHSTYHCQSHMYLFGLAFELIYSEREKVRSTLARWLGVPRFSHHLAPALA